MSATAGDKPVRRFPLPCWTQEEALALIQIYRDRWYALRRGYLRTADWDAVAEEVGRLCPGATPPKTSAQCRHKIEKLRQRYRSEKKYWQSFPGRRFVSTWFYFEAMDSLENNGTGNGSNPDEETNTEGMQAVNSKINHQSNTNIDSVYGGNRFKSVAADSNLVTIASRANNFRASQGEDYDDETVDVYYSGKNIRLSSQNYATRFQSDHNIEHSGVRPRKLSKIGPNSNHNHGYWNEINQDEDNDLGEDDVWVKMVKDRNLGSMDYNRNSKHHCSDGGSEFSRIRRDNDAIGEIVTSIKLLTDGFVKMEKMKMDMVHEIEKTRMEAEMKRNKLLLDSQRQIVEAFVTCLSENKKQHK
ncbi:hypothetical protein R6Q59_032076 [Mikania micrantha]|uniref:Myb-like domain-containing protein n=1 Tax=Mikania micrantha TaxID=192012 RepID=A0A5N6NRV0_9ASTR|nr:hypothetical protein E3N88_16799 [Mikania micrantha]